MFKSITAAAIAAIFIASTTTSAQTSAFTYQGTLDDAGTPANGSYDIQFFLFNHPTLDFDTFLVADTVLGVTVTDGLFSVEVDLGNNHFSTTQERYLELRVRPAGGPAYTILTPRQLLTTSPSAVRSQFADLAFSADTVNFPVVEFVDSSGALLRLVNDHPSGIGIVGQGTNRGLSGIGGAPAFGTPSAPAQTGVSGFSNTVGVQGSSMAGTGVVGASAIGTGGHFTSDATTANSIALFANITTTTPGSFSTAIRGHNNGEGGSGIGVYGSQAGSGWGVYGTTNGTGVGVFGDAGVSGIGIRGDGGGGGTAGWFNGLVNIVGTLTKSGGSFKIDHPLDPKNMYLSHSFVESPDMKNIYDGVVTLNKHGQAIVTLPSYFNALNQEFRYQLTTIGGYAPVYIAAEIESSINAQQFAIAGGTPGLKVSWQVTGIRHDAWANKNRIPIEEYKADNEIGLYLNPESFGQPKELGIGYIQTQD